MYFHNNNTDSSESVGTAGKPILREEILRHRDMIFAAERSRLNGEPVFTQAALDKRMEALLHAGG